MKREQFTFYRSYYDALRAMPKKDVANFVLAVCAYALDEEPPKLTGNALSNFILIRPTLDSGRRKAENRKNKQKQIENKKEQTDNKPEQTDNEGEGEKEIESECERELESESEKDFFTLEQTGTPDDDDDVLRSVRAHREDVGLLEARWKATGGRLCAMDYQTIDALLSEYDAQDIAEAMIRASENGAGGKWVYVRKVLANWKTYGKERRVDKPAAQGGDLMMRSTPEERRQTYSAAVLDFDE